LLAVTVCSLAWNQFGSILARDWLPYAIATALLVAGLLLSARAQRPTASAIAGLVGLLGLAGWDALSLRWSAVPELARDEALLVVFYALMFTVPLLVLRGEGDRRAATILVIAALVTLALATFVHLLLTGRPTDYYEDGRLTFPISYVNAQAALFLVSFWPSVAVAAWRAHHPLLRGAAIGGATALLAGWLMTQSKGGLVALAASGIVFFAVNRERLRSVVSAAVPIALVGGAYLPLTLPFRDRNAAHFANAIRSAAMTALVLVAVATLVGIVYALVDRRVKLSAGAVRVAGILLLVASAAAIVGSVATFVIVVDRPGHYIHARWESFKRLPAHERGTSHLTSLGSNRYDFWRVQVHLTRDHPLAGVGARGFATEYLIHRRSVETPQRGHSLELDTVSETGVVGLALLLAAIGLPLGAALRRSRSSSLLAGIAAACVYGILHMSVDWIWTVPAFGTTFFILLGVANAGTSGDVRPPLLGNRLALAGGITTLAIAIGGFALPWLSARLTSAGIRHPSSAAADFRWARRLDPLSVDPFLAEASVAPTPAAALPPLRRSVAKEPRVASLHYRLGLAYLAAGRKAAARRELATAQRLDPTDDMIKKALSASR
jgi:hypothetical protein